MFLSAKPIGFSIFRFANITRRASGLLLVYESPCSKLQGIKADFILPSHPNPLPREREYGFDPATSCGELSS